jgi:hypothetical protein
VSATYKKNEKAFSSLTGIGVNDNMVVETILLTVIDMFKDGTRLLETPTK